MRILYLRDFKFQIPIGGMAGVTKRTEKAANRHQRTRADHATELAEDYVEAVAEIVAAGGVCRVKDLANRFRVSHVTASRAVARLQKAGLATTRPHAPVELTEAGERLARASQQRHETVYRFLLALGVSEATAASDTEGMEHHVSGETLALMAAYTRRQSGAPNA